MMTGENWGKVVQVIGPTVDCEFLSDNLPNILNALKINDDKQNIHLTVEVAIHIGDNVVRCTSLASTDGLVRGMPVLDTGGPISVPVGPKTLGRVFNLLGEPIDERGAVNIEKGDPIHRPAPSFADQEKKTSIFETGIKA